MDSLLDKTLRANLSLKCAPGPRYAKEWEFAVVLLEWVYSMYIDDLLRKLYKPPTQPERKIARGSLRSVRRPPPPPPPSEDEILEGFGDRVYWAMDVDEKYFDFVEGLIPADYR